jgi:rare lipoprotein A
MSNVRTGQAGRTAPIVAANLTAVLLAVACAPLPPSGADAASQPAVAAPPSPPPGAAQRTDIAPPAGPTQRTDAPAQRDVATSAVERGRVSHYGDEFAGRKTASGALFDPDGLTMAHRTLPFGTRVRVTNLENKRSVEVVVTDRGPAIRDRIADLSLGAARKLGMVANGVVDALLEIVSPAASR